MMKSPIRKAVFPVGGLGTRFLPATKAMPKEMLPILDKPLIQYAVEEALAAGIEEFIFVTGRGKTAIEDHFDRAIELESLLQAREDKACLEAIQSLSLLPGKIAYVRQQEPLGLGHAVWCARLLVGDEPFAVLLADDFILGSKPCLAEMIEAYQSVGGNIVAVMDVAPDQTQRYGIVDVEQDQNKLVKAKGVVEKPLPHEAPSCVAIVGRYILDAAIFDVLARGEQGAGGEIQLTDALAHLLQNQDLHGLRFEGKRFDCGSKEGMLRATLASALARDDFRDLALKLIEEWSGTMKVSSTCK